MSECKCPINMDTLTIVIILPQLRDTLYKILTHLSNDYSREYLSNINIGEGQYAVIYFGSRYIDWACDINIDHLNITTTYVLLK